MLRATLLTVLFSGWLVGAMIPTSTVAVGREHYRAGHPGTAAHHLEFVLKADPGNAEAAYWLAMSYQSMADIATPFGGHFRSKAHRYFIRAMQLAPARTDYRMAFFDFLLDAADSSASSLLEARRLVESTRECDPDYTEMRRRLAEEERALGGMERRVTRVWAIVERSVVR